MRVDDLAAALRQAHPELEAVRREAQDPVYLVGGAVRDLLLGRPGADVDLVVEGDAAALAARLGGEGTEHERFGTVKVELEGHEVDVATARTETYSHPGALPDVIPAARVEADLGRRDFTINAMAIPLQGEPRLIDPHSGREDLDQRLLRVLHPRSFEDDPTRAIRAARYASRLGFALEPETEALLRGADLGAISADRRRAELRRLAGEATATAGFQLLAEWGLIEPRQGGLELARAVDKLLARDDHWAEFSPREEALVAAALGPVGAEASIAALPPPPPAEGVDVAGGYTPVELILARAMGAEWIESYLTAWITVELEIGGSDLIAAGVPQGPAVGRGLHEARRRKLEGEIAGRDEELAAALEAARAE
jgi:tRNA nucleotidyltransferase (CCA-adding enzyme)